MRSKIGRLLRKEFPARLRNALPQFKELPLEIQKQCRLFGWPVAPDLFFLILLEPSPKTDQFTCSIGWNNEPTFPFYGPQSNLDEVRTGAEKCRLRISQFYRQPFGNEPWWTVDARPTMGQITARLHQGIEYEAPLEECLPKVIPLVEEAVQCLIEHAIPFFRKIASDKGHSLAE